MWHSTKFDPDRARYDVRDITKEVWFFREIGTPKFRTESSLWTFIRLVLVKEGYDVVKQNPAKDGNLTSAPWYIRDRAGKWCLHDGDYQLCALHEAYNRGETIRLFYHEF
jgi:hypothetical protein